MPSLFISCVSNEFSHYRDAVRKSLTRPNLDTKIQEDFIAFGGATLEKIDEYIQPCIAVIHICGNMTGSMANHISVQYINNKYPDFATRFPQLQPVLEGNTPSSYTQWEAYIAAYHGKRLFIAVPTSSAKRNKTYTKDPEQVTLQEAHLNRLKDLGFYAEIHFDNKDELVSKLYQSKLGDILNTISKVKPINLPYHSIGANFKGRGNLIKELHESRPAITGDISGIAIHGLGGMGQTRLTVEYEWQHKDNYTALLFVEAGSPEILISKIANLSNPGVMDLPGLEGDDENKKYAAVIKWLNQFSGWMLIFDNVDTTEAAEKVEKVFAELQHGQELITTRIDTVSSQIKKKRVDVLDKNDAITFLLETRVNNRLKTSNDDERLRQ